MSTDVEIEEFLEHFGVKGMRWGVRGTRRVQKRLDRANRILEGKGSLKDNLLRSAFTKKGINRQLQRGADDQAKILAGKKRVSNALATASGIKIKNLDYGRKGDANAKMDNGRKAAIAYLGVVGGISLASAVANR
jgi:hypothetical protein